jgi:hypothetical protein
MAPARPSCFMNADPFQIPQSQLKQCYHLAGTAYRRGAPS